MMENKSLMKNYFKHSMIPLVISILLFNCMEQLNIADEPYVIPVLIVKYFPVDGKKIDIKVTGDWGISLSRTRGKVDGATLGIIKALEEGSRYHGYKDETAKPSLNYTIVDQYEFLDPLPVYDKSGRRAPMTDYNAIMNRIDIKNWVEEKGVKEVWIWGYHGGVLDLWESNMAGPYGDISNSDRDPDDLPILNTTYTVYHYNYQRNVSEAVENHMHQLEAILNFVDGRDEKPDKWSELLYWGKFVGSDKSHKIITPHAGWSHYPPNGEHDYDWDNEKYIETDIEDWKPDGSGIKKRINSERWNKSSLQWFIYWMQNHPGKDNELLYQGKKLTNWWRFIGDFDGVMKNNVKLTEK